MGKVDTCMYTIRVFYDVGLQGELTFKLRKKLPHILHNENNIFIQRGHSLIMK